MSTTDTRGDYVARLEAHLRLMAEGMESLRRELATTTQRNRELEYSHSQLMNYNGDAQREALRRAEGIVAEAEARVGQIIDEGRLRAREVEARARARAEEMIATVSAEIDGLEQEANRRLQAAEQRAGRAAGATGSPPSVPGSEAAGSEAELAAVREQINELLRLRERILVGIRAALAGFGERLGELEAMPLVEDGPEPDAAEAEPAAETSSVAQSAAAGPVAVELIAEPISSFTLAGELEQRLTDIAGVSTVLLRSIEDGRASLDVAGLSAEQLTPAVAERFPEARCELVEGNSLHLELGAPKAVRR
jgi:hypothetical protein